MNLSDEQKASAQVFLPADGEYSEFKTDDEVEWEKFRDEMSDGINYAKLTIYKVPLNDRGSPIKQQMGYCFECGMQDYSFSQLCSRIQSEFGGGVYRLQARNESGQLVKNKAISIEAPIKPDGSRAESPGEIIDRVQNAINQGQEQTRRMLVGAQNPNAIHDPIKQMTEMMSAMGSMMGAMGLKPQEVQPQKSFMDSMQEFIAMREMMESFGGGNSGGEANLYSLLGETIRAFGGPMAQAMAAAKQSGEINAAGLLENPAPPEITDEQKQQAKDAEQLKGQIKLLIANAESGADAKQFAAIVVEKTPDDMSDKLFEFLNSEDWFKKIVLLVPEAEAHKNWFTDWRDTVIDLLAEPLTDESETPIVAESETVAEIDQSDSDISDTPDSDVSPDT